jgi:hypothetical protein
MWVRRLFWQKPIDDKNAFKLLCFLIGNGCPPLYCCKWILSSQFWNGRYNLCDKLEKRISQMEHFFTKFSSKKHEWFYYDLILQMYVFMDGSERKK